MRCGPFIARPLKQLEINCAQNKNEWYNPYIVYLLLNLLATSKVILGRVPTCDDEHS